MQEHREKTEHGAIIVEATIALTTFMFAMYMLLSVIQMAYVQERIAVTLDATTKEMAEYAHVCFASEGDAVFTGQGGKSSSIANEISKLLTTIGNKLGNSTLTDAGSALKGDSLSELGKKLIGVKLGEELFKANLVPGGDADAFLKRSHVDSWTLGRSEFLGGSDSTEIVMEIDYDMHVVQLLKVDVKFHMKHISYARAWAGGDK